MKHAESQAKMLNRGMEKSASERVVASPSGDGLSLLRARVSGAEQLLNTIDRPMLDKLEKLANKGCTLFEIANVLGVPFVEIAGARLLSVKFNELCNVLETRAVSVHLTAAREGITNPKQFSPAAYDRVMAALGFTPHAHWKY